jgi:hypothetical protein
MRLVQVVKDTTMLVSGYEHHTWQCSSCSTVERRMTFTSESTPPPMVAVELAQTAPVEPDQMAPREPNQTVQVEPSQPMPVETTVPAEAAQTVTAEPTIPDQQPPRFKRAARPKALDKVQKREAGASEADRRLRPHRGIERHYIRRTHSAPKKPVASPAPTIRPPDRAVG